MHAWVPELYRCGQEYPDHDLVHRNLLMMPLYACGPELYRCLPEYPSHACGAL